MLQQSNYNQGKASESELIIAAEEEPEKNGEIVQVSIGQENRAYQFHQMLGRRMDETSKKRKKHYNIKLHEKIETGENCQVQKQCRKV